MSSNLDYREYIANIPDFPSPGILYRDIQPLLADPHAFTSAIDDVAALTKSKPDYWVGIESLSLFAHDRPALIGVLHLPPLPGSPRWQGDFEAVRRFALADAAAYLAGGADGLVVENFGDAPFFASAVPSHTVAAMARIAAEVVEAAAGVPVGINVLRNDAQAAMGIAAASGASFVRDIEDGLNEVLVKDLILAEGIYQNNISNINMIFNSGISKVSKGQCINRYLPLWKISSDTINSL